MKEFDIEELDDNGFLFTFPSTDTLSCVLVQSLWNIKGHLLVLKPCIPGAIIAELKLDLAPLWV